jgi:hypothetical protein
MGMVIVSMVSEKIFMAKIVRKIYQVRKSKVDEETPIE